MDLLGSVNELPLLALHQTLLVAQGGLQVALSVHGLDQVNLRNLQVIGHFLHLGRLLLQLALELSDPLSLGVDLLGSFGQVTLLALHEPLLVTEGGLHVALSLLGLYQILLSVLQVINNFLHLSCLLLQLALELGDPLSLGVDLLGSVNELPLLALHQTLLVAEGGHQVALSVHGLDQVNLRNLQVIGHFLHLGRLLLQLALELSDPLSLGVDLLGSFGQVTLLALHEPLLVTEGGLHVALSLLGLDQIHLGVLQVISCFLCLCGLVTKLALQLGNPLSLGVDLLGGIVEISLLALHNKLLVTESRLQVALGFLGLCQIHLGILQIISHSLYLDRLGLQLALELSDPLALGLGILGSINELPLLVLNLPPFITKGSLQVRFRLLCFHQLHHSFLQITRRLLCLGCLLPQLALELRDPLALDLDLMRSVTELGARAPKLALKICNLLALVLHFLLSATQILLLVLNLPPLVPEISLQATLLILSLRQICLCPLEVIGNSYHLSSLVTELPLKLCDFIVLGPDFIGSVAQLALLGLHQPLPITQGCLEVTLILLGPHQIGAGVFQSIRCPFSLGRLGLQLMIQVRDPLTLRPDLLGSISQASLLRLHQALLVTKVGLQVTDVLLGVCQVSLRALQDARDLLRFVSLVQQLPLEVSNCVCLVSCRTSCISQVLVSGKQIPPEDLESFSSIHQLVPRGCQIALENALVALGL